MRKVLLVEDDPFIRDLTSIKFAEAAYSIAIASTGKSGLRILKEDAPDIILLDLDLPDISGFEFLKKVKSDAQLKSVPVIIFSNNDNESVRTEAEEIGVAGFFVKASTSFDVLEKHIASVLQHR